MAINFAHRGSLTEAPENTIPSFQRALDHGAKAIELDIQLSKDQELIVWHDATFNRFNAKETSRINTYTIDEIKTIYLGKTFPEPYKETRPATLGEVLKICPPEIMLNIEIKNIPIIHHGIEEKLIECLKIYNRSDNILISSFDHVALKKVQNLAPYIKLGMLFFYRPIDPWLYAKKSGLNIYSIHPNNVYTDNYLIKNCQRLGYRVYPFTVNHKRRYDELIQLGVDGVFSDNPKIFGT